jgi:hypothetical protein
VNPGQNTSVEKGAGKAGETCVNSKWPKVMLMSGITSAWLLYDMATATKAPSRGLAVLQYGLLACALVGLIGSLRMLASKK